MSIKNVFHRIATFVDWEHQIQVAPDVWDVDPARVCRISETANAFVEKHEVGIVLPVSYDVKLVEQKEQGRRRIYMHTLAIVYLPKEIISDGQRELKGATQETPAEAQGAAGGTGQEAEEIRFKDVNDLGRFLNQFGVDPNAFAAAAGSVPISFGNGAPGGAAPRLPLPGQGPPGPAPQEPGG